MTKPRNDRISHLPTDVLTHIISRMPMKTAVRTSTLSQHWRDKYASTFDIDVNDTYLKGVVDIDQFETRISSFRGLMNRLLTPGDSRITSFRVILHGNRHFPNDLEEWMPNILGRGVQNLEIQAFSIQNIHFSGILSSCVSLTTLKLALNGTLSVTVTNCFPNLKSLFIEGKHGVIKIYNEQTPEAGKSLLLNFRVLESLKLRNCRFVEVDLVEIVAPQLVTCRMDCAFSFLQHNDYTIKIVGAKLAHFNSYEGCLDQFVMCAPELHYASFGNRYFKNGILGRRVRAFLHGVPSLEGLKLSSQIAEVLVKQWKRAHVTPTFTRLKQLELWWHPKELLELLDLMPYLESLKLNMSYQYPYKNEEPVTPFLFPQLKEVKLVDFRGDDTQIELAKVFLENARRLEKLVVSLGENPFRVKKEIARLLQEFTRTSSSCLIVVT